MVPLRRVLALSGLGLLIASCGFFSDSSAAGNAETDRQSRTLADAIAYPRQENADGFARAALATNLGATPSFTLLEAADIKQVELNDPMARLVWRIHHDAFDDGRVKTPEITACYTVEFNYYGTSSGPDRMTCPANAVAYVPPPLARRDIPQDFAPALEVTLGKVPANPTEADVRAALAAGLPQPPVDAETGLAGIPPESFVHVRGADVGVALFARTGVGSKDCMMGRRLGGEVKVWSLNDRDLTMLEKSCSGEAALSS